jgi:ketosteroid isomerase-like protein
MLSLRIGLLMLIWTTAVSPAEQARAPLAALKTERQAIEELTSRFLTSFENLDMPAFIACFSEDATVFFPSPEPPERFSGKDAVRTRFQKVFDSIRNGASSGPPYHRLIPQDVDIQLLGADAAVVSFHLSNTERLARRTLVLKNVHGEWLIAHLHASNVSRAPEGAH